MKDLIRELGISENQLRKILFAKKSTPKILKQNISDECFTFAIVSDTHLGSKLEKIDELYTFYEICRKEEIQTVIHSGDK